MVSLAKEGSVPKVPGKPSTDGYVRQLSSGIGGAADKVD